jgi:hypothetical protein
MNQNSIHEEIKYRLKSGMLVIILCRIFCISVSKSVEIKIYRTITLLVVLYGCETLSLTLREERMRIRCCGECLVLREMR